MKTAEYAEDAEEEVFSRSTKDRLCALKKTAQPRDGRATHH